MGHVASVNAQAYSETEVTVTTEISPETFTDFSPQTSVSKDHQRVHCASTVPRSEEADMPAETNQVCLEKLTSESPKKEKIATVRSNNSDYQENENSAEKSSKALPVQPPQVNRSVDKRLNRYTVRELRPFESRK